MGRTGGAGTCGRVSVFERASVRSFAQLASTSDTVRVLAHAGESGPLWVQAHQQTGGRGRRGRVWISEPGNLYASELRLTNTDSVQAAGAVSLWTFASALAVADAAGQYVDAQRLRLKWPNDVLLDGAKLAGILLETGEGPKGRWASTGIGVNLLQAPEGLGRATISLSAAGVRPVPGALEILGIISDRYDYWREVLAIRGFAALAASWLTRAHPIGTALTIDTGSSLVHGQFDGLGTDGALCLRLPDGALRHFHAGDVSVREPAP